MVLTTETRMNDIAFIDYFSEFIPKWNKIFRYTWYKVKDPAFKKTEALDLKTLVAHEFNILARTSNSIISEAIGRLDALKKLKATELKQKEQRIKELTKQVKELEKKINKQKKNAYKLKVDKLKVYQGLKKSLYWKKNKLNKTKQSYDKLKEQIDKKQYSMAFGGKAFKKYNNGEISKREYRILRDRYVYYLGSSDESNGNQLFQVSFNKEGCFAKIRREYCDDKDKKYLLCSLPLKYKKDELINYTGPLSYRVI